MYIHTEILNSIYIEILTTLRTMDLALRHSSIYLTHILDIFHIRFGSTLTQIVVQMEVASVDIQHF